MATDRNDEFVFELITKAAFTSSLQTGAPLMAREFEEDFAGRTLNFCVPPTNREIWCDSRPCTAPVQLQSTGFDRTRMRAGFS
jgi:hypothetical protein